MEKEILKEIGTETEKESKKDWNTLQLIYISI